MGRIHHDLQAAQAQIVGKRAFAELDVAACRIVERRVLPRLRESTHAGSASIKASTSSSQASGSLVPWALKNLMPLSGTGCGWH
jgi:hypothetical protein